MAYTKNTWKDGDLITAEKLNKMEDGIQIAMNTPGPRGDKGDPGLDAVITPGVAAADLAEDADTAAVRATVNLLLASLRTAGFFEDVVHDA